MLEGVIGIGLCTYWRHLLGGALRRIYCILLYPLFLLPLWYMTDWRVWLFGSIFGLLFWIKGMDNWNSFLSMIGRYGLIIGTTWTACKRYCPTIFGYDTAELASSFIYHLIVFGTVFLAKEI